MTTTKDRHSSSTFNPHHPFHFPIILYHQFHLFHRTFNQITGFTLETKKVEILYLVHEESGVGSCQMLGEGSSSGAAGKRRRRPQPRPRGVPVQQENPPDLRHRRIRYEGQERIHIC
ncbi:hypothetical protein Hanom_Chr01g00046701 [Helianthus anomalus]